MDNEKDNQMNSLETKQVEFEAWLENVRDKDNEIFDLVNESAIGVLNQIKESEFAETLSILFAFMGNTNFIKNGVYDACEKDNLYSAKILFRSLIEHWIKSQYIWVRFGKEKNNDVGREYRLFCALDEQVKYGNSLIKLNEILGAEQRGEDPWELVFTLKPELQKEHTKKTIKHKVKQFEYRKIIEFLINQTDLGNDGFLTPAIPEYSELSSFVHGGPEAINFMATVGTERYENYQGMIRFSFNICKMTTFITYSCVASHCDHDILATAVAIKDIELQENSIDES